MKLDFDENKLNAEVGDHNPLKHNENLSFIVKDTENLLQSALVEFWLIDEDVKESKNYSGLIIIIVFLILSLIFISIMFLFLMHNRTTDQHKNSIKKHFGKKNSLKTSTVLSESILKWNKKLVVIHRKKTIDSYENFDIDVESKKRSTSTKDMPKDSYDRFDQSSFENPVNMSQPQHNLDTIEQLSEI